MRVASTDLVACSSILFLLSSTAAIFFLRSSLISSTSARLVPCIFSIMGVHFSLADFTSRSRVFTADAVAEIRCSCANFMAISKAAAPTCRALAIEIHAWRTCLRAMNHSTHIPTALTNIPAEADTANTISRPPASAVARANVPVIKIDGTNRIGPRNKPGSFNLRNRSSASMAIAACVANIPSQDLGPRLAFMGGAGGSDWR